MVQSTLFEKIMDHMAGFIMSLIISVCMIIKCVLQCIGTIIKYTVVGFSKANNDRIESKIFSNFDNGIF